MICPKCQSELVIKYHKVLSDKDLKKPYIFGHWFKCHKCSYIKLVEEAKIFNQTSYRGQIKTMQKLKLI